MHLCTNQVRQFSFVRAPGPQNADNSASGLEDGGVVSMPVMALKLFVKSGIRKVGGVASGPIATANETKFSVVDARCTNGRRGESSAAEGNGGRGGRGTFGGGMGGGFRRARRDLKVWNR
jgi:hypothetical protein